MDPRSYSQRVKQAYELAQLRGRPVARAILRQVIRTQIRMVSGSSYYAVTF